MASGKSGNPSHKSLIVLIWVSFSAALLFVALRTIIRIRIPTTHHVTPLEDCFIFLGLAALLALCILETIQLPSLYYITSVLRGTIPITTAELIISQTERYLRYQFPIVILFWTVLWSIKAAFLALYWRLFRDLVWYRRAWTVLAIITFLAYGGCIATLSVSCGSDVRNFFAFYKCGASDNVRRSNFSVYFSTAVDVFTDLCIMAMPLRLLYNLRVSFSQKLGLACVFSLGFVMITFAIIRANQSLAQNEFVHLTLLLIWSTLAASISVLVGTLPAFKVLITARARASKSRSGNGEYRGVEKKQVSSADKSARSAHSVALTPVHNDNARSIKTGASCTSQATESQEEILVRRETTISYDSVPHPSPAMRYYQRFRQGF